MFIPVFIDVALSLVAIFFILCTSVASFNEVITAFIKGRGRFLKRSISVLLDEANNIGFMDKIYSSPHIYKDRIFSWLGRKSYLPANISADNFSNAIMEEVNKLFSNSPEVSIDKLLESVRNMPEGHLKNLFLQFTYGVEGDLEKVKGKIVAWYNLNMDSVSKLYKLRLKTISLITGLIFCIVLNIDAINYTAFLWTNKNSRDIIVNYAEGLAQRPAPIEKSVNPDSVNIVSNIKAMQDSLQVISQFNIPLGWDHVLSDNSFIAKKGNQPNWLLFGLIKVIGIFLSATAISMGAPFWFEVLNKIVGVKKMIEKT